MSNILLDTHIFRKLLDEMNDLLTCITNTRDTIIITNEIMAEVTGRMKPKSPLALYGYIEEIKKKCEVIPVKINRIEARYKRYTNQHSVRLPQHSKDHKWVKTAISEHAKYIISYDSDLSLPPFQINGNTCCSITPEQYIEENCPTQNNQ